jgi:hypothetical protein
MMRLVFAATTLAMSSFALAQTTLDIGVPPNAGTNICSYVTGAVTSGSTPGHLQATASSYSGNGCTTSNGSGDTSVSFGPASPIAPATTTLSSNTGTVSFTLQPLNAVSCSGTITNANGGSFVSGATFCTSLATCSTLLSSSATFTNTGTTSAAYHVNASCQGATGAPIVSTAIVNVPPPGGGGGGGSCFAIPDGTGKTVTRLTGTPYVYFYGNGARNGDIKTDVTSYDAVWLTPFPGAIPAGQLVRFDLNKANYISLAFTIPVGYGTNHSGFTEWFQLGSSDVAANVSMSVSTACGDFSEPTNPGSTVVAEKCWKNNGRGTSGIVWQEAPDSTKCVLQEGKPYYLNLINADVSKVGANGTGSVTTFYPGYNCSGDSCTLPIQNGPRSY